MKTKKLLFFLAACALVLTFAAPTRAQGTATQVRSGSSLPANCAVKDVFVKTSAPIGLHVCVAENTWKFVLPVVITSGAAGDFICTTDGSAWVNCFNGLPTRADDDGTMTILDGDKDYLLTCSNGSACAVGIGRAGYDNKFALGWTTTFKCNGAGACTITPTTSSIWNGSSFGTSLVLGIGDSATITVVDVTGNGKYDAQIKRAAGGSLQTSGDVVDGSGTNFGTCGAGNCWLPLTGHISSGLAQASSEAAAASPMARTGAVLDTCFVMTTPGTSATFQLRKNGADVTSATVTINNGETAKCTSGVSSSYVVGDTYDWALTGTIGTVNIRWTTKQQ